MRIETTINTREFQELAKNLSVEKLRRATRTAMRRASLAGRVAGSRLLRGTLRLPHKEAKKRFRFSGNIKEKSLPVNAYYQILRVGKKGELVNKFRTSVARINTKRGPNVNVAYETPKGRVGNAGFIFKNRKLSLVASQGMMIVKRVAKGKYPVSATLGPSASVVLEEQGNTLTLKNAVEKRFHTELSRFASHLARGGSP